MPGINTGPAVPGSLIGEAIMKEKRTISVTSIDGQPVENISVDVPYPGRFEMPIPGKGRAEFDWENLYDVREFEESYPFFWGSCVDKSSVSDLCAFLDFLDSNIISTKYFIRGDLYDQNGEFRVAVSMQIVADWLDDDPMVVQPDYDVGIVDSTSQNRISASEFVEYIVKTMRDRGEQIPTEIAKRISLHSIPVDLSI
jgi:hypothetical protein